MLQIKNPTGKVLQYKRSGTRVHGYYRQLPGERITHELVAYPKTNWIYYGRLYAIVALFIILCSQLKIAIGTFSETLNVYAYTQEHGLISPVPYLIPAPIPQPNFSITSLIVHTFFIATPEAKVAPIPSPTPENTPVPVEQKPAISKWQSFIDAVNNLSPLFGFEGVKKVILAQAAEESGRGTSSLAIGRNNFLGINALDWNPDAAWSFDSAAECVVSYFMLIKRNFPEAYAHRDNPEVYLRLLKQNSAGMMYATDPEYQFKVMSEPEWSNN